ncbi:hypothetical protein Pst134EA_011730 [Puccinia striiformis f. sp. tritici]|nr:hypothetical protein Pst134EA_011730 [Puccinia striiformis f. sp. tritici]KAH9468109.1 hypothetical protein Pst134EA_011730 [Puccinia striiformis f. sp. tritici]
MMQNHRGGMLMIDATHNTVANNFMEGKLKISLYTVMLHDPIVGKGLPVAWAFTLAESHEPVRRLLSWLQDTSGSRLQSVMSDCALAIANAVAHTFPPLSGDCTKHYWCLFHVFKAFKAKAKTLLPGRADEAYQAFRKIVYKVSPVFGSYVWKQWIWRLTHWSMFFQTTAHQGVHTNPYTEAWHRVLKDEYIRPRACKRIDEVLHILIHEIEPKYRWSQLQVANGFVGQTINKFQHCMHKTLGIRAVKHTSQGPSLPFIPTGTLTSVPMPMLTSRHVSLLTPAGRWQPSHESDIEIMTSPQENLLRTCRDPLLTSLPIGTLTSVPIPLLTSHNVSLLTLAPLDSNIEFLEIPMPPLTSGRLSSLSHAPLAAFRGPSLTSLPTGTHTLVPMPLFTSRHVPLLTPAGRWQPSKESDIEIMTGPQENLLRNHPFPSRPTKRPQTFEATTEPSKKKTRQRRHALVRVCPLVAPDTVGPPTRSIIFPNVSNNSLTVLHWDGVYDVARESQFLNNLNEWDTNVLKSNAMESGRRGLNEIVEILKVQKTRDKFADAALLVVMNQFRLCLNVILQMVEEGLPGVYITVEHDIPGVARKLLGFLLEEKNVNIFK